ncbi:polysaccharide lyase family 7 protein [Psychrosphaera algicola]|uniref:Polysaccharide lyase family 7 protein n=1 Tax=Psychrosphaera algicola TaxID=3023714 RepID=A0ABT5FAN1_9GAMM|nr:polysaccharide lyase family 7 protein [Psychrosphaera sp. G1-22]MDC2888585.1 polysaccharide lyase family 7 protein [Psychrosphaera sp. G1-22]
MKIILSAIALMLLLAGCTADPSMGESKPQNDTVVDDNSGTTEPETYPDLEPISCSSIFELGIESVSTEQTDAVGFSVNYLIDKKYKDNLVWKSQSNGTSAIIKLTKGALISDVLVSWLNPNISHYYEIHVSDNLVDWQEVVVSGSSDPDSLIATRINFDEDGTGAITGRFVKFTSLGNELNDISDIIEIQVFGCDRTVTQNIELIDWYLSVPTDVDNNGKSDSIYENDLAGGYFDPRFFYQSIDAGLVFRTNVRGFKTSENTKYIRTELREMLRRGNKSISTQGINKNNWVFSSASATEQAKAGGVDGVLRTTLKVDHVTSTGEDYQIGRVIIGQIHANDDEPIRLYYRKLPNNSKGSIYFAHEVLGGDDVYREMLGSRSDNASNPSDGIELGETFTYEIKVVGDQLDVTISQNETQLAFERFDMSGSRYGSGNQYMYFKAGVYNQNNSGDSHDYAQVTIYDLVNTHN